MVDLLSERIDMRCELGNDRVDVLQVVLLESLELSDGAE